jgi:hypothetical protein
MEGAWPRTLFFIWSAHFFLNCSRANHSKRDFVRSLVARRDFGAEIKHSKFYRLSLRFYVLLAKTLLAYEQGTLTNELLTLS